MSSRPRYDIVLAEVDPLRKLECQEIPQVKHRSIDSFVSIDIAIYDAQPIEEIVPSIATARVCFAQIINDFLIEPQSINRVDCLWEGV